MFIKCVVKNGISTHQAQLLDPPRFLNHQQCYQCEPKKNFAISKGLWIFLPSSWIIGFFNQKKIHLSKLPPQNIAPRNLCLSPSKKSGDEPPQKKNTTKNLRRFCPPLNRGAKVYPLCCKTSRSLASRSWLELNGLNGRLGKVGEGSFNHHDGVIYIYSVNPKSW